MNNDDLIQALRDLEAIYRAGQQHRLEPRVTAEAFKLAAIALEQLNRPPVRASDPTTSKQAADSVRLRAGSQRAKLLAAYLAHPEGLTDEEAGHHAGLSDAGYWKRCSELRQSCFIQPLGFSRLSTFGERQQVCGLTESGKVLVESGSLVVSR